jgi:hypothetical protein
MTVFRHFQAMQKGLHVRIVIMLVKTDFTARPALVPE